MARLTLTFKDITLQVLPIEADEIGIGRDPDNALHIDSLAVAPHHAVVRIDDEGATIRQLDMAHPVFVNDQQVTERLLTNGDRITIGKHEVIFTDDESRLAGSAKPSGAIPKPLHPTREASLQVLKGKSIGLIIPLRSGLTRLGKGDSGSAVIARRKEGYFLSALSDAHAVRVNDEPVDDRSVHLNDGDILRISDHLFQFFCK